MNKHMSWTALSAATLTATWLTQAVLAAQQAAPPTAQNQASASEPAYKPPTHGIPGGRVGGASRGTPNATAETIDLLAPDDHAGLTTSAAPTLYFFVSRPINYKTEFTISVAGQPSPVLEVDIPSPSATGIYSFRTADYRVRLEPGVLYTWSVSAMVDARAPSRDIVASAALFRVPPDPALDYQLRNAFPTRRAKLLAQAGLWYDAVAAAAETATLDRHTELDALINEVGLVEAANYDFQLARRVP
jgi:Domain of Unknown Function (DUF928)